MNDENQTRGAEAKEAEIGRVVEATSCGLPRGRNE